MRRRSRGSSFSVYLELKVPGPAKQRTKYKDHELITAQRRIVLPFAPFPGLLLAFSRPRRRGMDETVYLRVRTVEWRVATGDFWCAVDEILTSHDMSESLEVRGSARIPEHFKRLQGELARAGFDVRTDMTAGSWALYKTASGIEMEPPPYAVATEGPVSPRSTRRHR